MTPRTPAAGRRPLRAAAAACSLLAAACAAGARPVRGAAGARPAAPAPTAADLDVQARWTMGTRLSIARARDPKADAAGAAAVARALDEADRLDALLSHYRPESPLSRANAAAGRFAPAPADLVAFLRAALDLARRTDGAFDPTAGALVRAHREGGVPEALAAARAATGWRLPEVRDDGVRLPPGGAIDPGAIGKGWAVDAMVRVLREAGVQAAFIDFGESSFYGLGAPPGQDGWRVRVRDAAGRPGGPVIVLHDLSLATSMTLALPERPEDPPRPHLCDPRTGELVRTPRIAAVVSPSATEADALSTALAVSGAAGLGLVDRFAGASAWLHEEGHAPLSRGAVPFAGAR